jgi:hypothetical protein
MIYVRLTDQEQKKINIGVRSGNVGFVAGEWRYVYWTENKKEYNKAQIIILDNYKEVLDAGACSDYWDIMVNPISMEFGETYLR